MDRNGQTSLHQRVWDIVAAVVDEEQLELVDLNLQPLKKGGLIKVIIDKPGGISINDCQGLSSRLNYVLDVEQIQMNSYTLEVSSPGIFFELKRESDFLRNRGKRIMVQYRASDGRSQTTYGILTDFKDMSLTLLDEEGTQQCFESGSILLVRLDPLLFPKKHQGRVHAKRGKK
ncbi:ribosome maturation factor RimP [bacterium]|nr:ribosome maturation factor RimP [bacterium]